jgi:hypothetical protein
VINLSLLNAGVGSSGAVGVGSGPSVGGQRPRNNNFTVEGIDNNSGSVTGPLVTVPNDAVAEFTVQQNQVSAEYRPLLGRPVQPGGQERRKPVARHGVRVQCRTATINAADNQSAMNGDELHPRYDNNRFGGSMGGPIKKNKIFFYGLYEYNPQGLSATPGALYAPTAAGWATISGIPGINQTSLNQLKLYLGTRPRPFPRPASAAPIPWWDRAMRAWDGVRRRQRRRNPSPLARSASMRRPTPTVSPA